ncbi:peptidoglycan-binding protein [Mucilaginibacter sp. KACC 22063]|uniref:peptidoglycan-binding protein n=1 Tax=Mucilaginibacter sp. KACC 22063 TaxID=3025666 RepID=UPI0023651570|nr:peptidoglycan-binding protein [Mucilaginibacter sp. KACC 22063]WDF54280.1 peptidoglycan-binding protein [Mucilaginibacter sp. KACC 22063]
MIKKQFEKELVISATCSKSTASKKADVLKIQSWLNLFALTHPDSGTATAIDGDFGPSTDKAVKNFQKFYSLSPNGVVDNALFSRMADPLNKAFTAKGKATDLRSLIVEIAQAHLAQHPYELVINNQSNSGPWVRSYMDGNEGKEWYWCMGFVQTILDQAASQLGKDFRTLMPLTYSCDTVGVTGIHKGLLIRSKDVRNNPSLVKPGDIFLLQKSPTDWYHTGFVTGVDNDIFETIEGNTNTDGSANGNGVYKRTRNFRKQTLDVFSIKPLV